MCYLYCKIKRVKHNFDTERVKILLTSKKDDNKNDTNEKIKNILVNFANELKFKNAEERYKNNSILEKEKKKIKIIITNNFIKGFKKKILKIVRLYAKIDKDELGFIINDDEDIDFMLYDKDDLNKSLISPVIEKVEFAKKSDKVLIETILEDKEIDYIIGELIEKDKIKYKLPVGYEIDVPSYLEKSPFTPMIIEKIQYNEEFRKSSKKIIKTFSKRVSRADIRYTNKYEYLIDTKYDTWIKGNLDKKIEEFENNKKDIYKRSNYDKKPVNAWFNLKPPRKILAKSEFINSEKDVLSIGETKDFERRKKEFCEKFIEQKYPVIRNKDPLSKEKLTNYLNQCFREKVVVNISTYSMDSKRYIWIMNDINELEYLVKYSSILVREEENPLMDKINEKQKFENMDLDSLLKFVGEKFNYAKSKKQIDFYMKEFLVPRKEYVNNRLTVQKIAMHYKKESVINAFACNIMNLNYYPQVVEYHNNNELVVASIFGKDKESVLAMDEIKKIRKNYKSSLRELDNKIRKDLAEYVNNKFYNN
jgi:predicted GIY-YIG superfamily endonuclease